MFHRLVLVLPKRKEKKGYASVAHLELVPRIAPPSLLHIYLTFAPQQPSRSHVSILILYRRIHVCCCFFQAEYQAEYQDFWILITLKCRPCSHIWISSQSIVSQAIEAHSVGSLVVRPSVASQRFQCHTFSVCFSHNVVRVEVFNHGGCTTPTPSLDAV